MAAVRGAPHPPSSPSSSSASALPSIFPPLLLHSLCQQGNSRPSYCHAIPFSVERQGRLSDLFYPLGRFDYGALTIFEKSL